MKNIREINQNMENLSKILNIKKFKYSEDEIKNVTKYFINCTDESQYTYMYCYIGESYINLIGGEWKLNTTKKDPAYGRMCVVDWSKGSVRIDPQKLIDKIVKSKDNGIIIKTIELTKRNIIEINDILKDLGLDF